MATYRHIDSLKQEVTINEIPIYYTSYGAQLVKLVHVHLYSFSQHKLMPRLVLVLVGQDPLEINLFMGL